jgi:hypothetical protein
MQIPTFFCFDFYRMLRQLITDQRDSGGRPRPIHFKGRQLRLGVAIVSNQRSELVSMWH